MKLSNKETKGRDDVRLAVGKYVNKLMMKRTSREGSGNLRNADHFFLSAIVTDVEIIVKISAHLGSLTLQSKNDGRE